MAGIPVRRRAPLLVPLVLLLAVVALGGTGYIAYRLVFGSSDLHARMLPADSDFYSTVLLDPPASQKVALLNLATRFPDVHNNNDTNKKLTDQANTALQSLGLKYQDDVQPWLGSQVSVGGKLGQLVGGSNPPDVVFLVASKDDKKAVAALDKARAHLTDLTWARHAHGGVDVWVGSAGQGPATAYAYIDHSVVLGTTEATVDRVIDTDAGKVARLSDAKDFQDIVGKLPAEHFVLGYANVPSLVTKIKAALNSGSVSNAGVKVTADQLKPLAAYRSAGFTLSAQSDRLVFDLKGGIDGSKLDSTTRDMINAAAHQDTLLSYIPKGVFAAMGTTGVKGTVKQLQQAAQGQGDSASGGTSLLPSSVTDPNGALSHLGNDFAAEIRPGGNLPSGGLVFQTNDPASTTQLLEQLAQQFSPAEPAIEVTPPAGPGQLPTIVAKTPAPRVETYRGIKITSLPASLAQPFQPAYAVGGGVAIVASSTNQVKALIDTHADHSDVTGSPEWTDASKGATQPLETAFFVDIQRSLEGAREKLSGADLSNFNNSTRDAAPLRELFISSQATTSGYSEQVVLVIR